MQPDELRRQTIIALFSNSVLSQLVTLKGGNALRLVYGQPRTSLDIDFSLSHDFDEDSLKRHLESAVRNHFRALGYGVVSLTFRPKPTTGAHKFGYDLDFRVLEERVFEKHKANPGKLRVFASDARNVIEIEFSKDEYLGSVRTVEWDVPVIVYTLEAITIEKIRALCQQLPDYLPRKNKTARSRDFYDICTALDGGADLFSEDSKHTAKEVFFAKAVSMDLLLKLDSDKEREHHRVDWRSVIDTVPTGSLQGFDYYFERVVKLAHDLHAHWQV